jgi:TRAP-type C4-dicarboxylate transport system permease large subunit
VVAALVVGGLVYRDFTIASLKESVVRSAETTGSIVLILLFSLMISRILAAQGVPQDLTVAVQAIAESPLVALALVVSVLIVAGALMDDVSVTVVVAPLFLPMMIANGIDPVHFAAIVATSVVIGANSPPVAPILFMSCRVCAAPVHDTVGPALRLMIFVATPVMLLTALWPGLSLTLPKMLGLL